MLITLSGLMLLLLLAEWGLMESSEISGNNASQISSNQKSIERGLPRLEMATQAIENYTDMVESPLFIEGRKPLLRLEDANKSLVVSNVDDLILSGIYSTGGQLFALFSKQGKETSYSKHKEGDDLAGWLIKKIQNDRVVLDRAGREQVLMLRKPKPKQKPKNKRKVRVSKQIKLKS